MPQAQRAKFERSLGRDLSGVRIHTDDAAADQASRVNARALASGQDILFARGEYEAHDEKSQHLLAHEVAHTAQQQGAAPTSELTTTEPGDAAERDADAAAGAMLAGAPVAVSSQPRSIARKTRDESLADPPSGVEAVGDAGPPGAPAERGGDGAPGTAERGGDGAPGAAKDGGEEIGELSADRIGAEPDEGEDVGPDVPVRDSEAGKQEIAAAGQQLPPEGGAEQVAGGVAPDAGVDASASAGGDGGAAGEEVSAAVVDAQSDTREAIAQSEAESAAYKADMTARRDRFEAEQHATTLEQLKAMGSIEKRQTLQEMGYDPKAVKKLKDAELDGLIEGKMESEQRKTKILGMDPEQLAGLSPGQKIQYLVDLGIDRGDLDKAGEAKATRLFDDVMKVAHVPGQHQVKIQIKGGLLGKSWVVKVKCDAEGNTDIQAEKKGGFLSKLWGWVKLALPIILTVLAPLTAGASLIVLAVYQTATAIKSGDWLGAVIGAAGALVGVGAFMAAAKGAAAAATTFSKIADVATKVKKVAEAAQLAMQAAKAKNAGSLLGALASGAAVFAASSSQTADKFAQTMKRWSERLDKWSKIIAGGQKVVQGIQKGDPLAAIGGAFDTAAATVKTNSPTAKTLTRASKITDHVSAGKRALEAKPPNYAAVAEAALGIAGQLKEDRRIEDASRIVARADRLKQAWDKRASDPAALADAALGLAEAIQLAKYDIEHDEGKDGDGKQVPEAERKTITDRYRRAGSIVRSASAAIKAATAKPRPSYLGALDAATQLIAELTDAKQIDAAAVVTTKLDAWTKAVSSKDEKAIQLAGLALGEAVNGLGTVIAAEHASAKRDAEAALAPGEALPEDSGEQLPPGPTASDFAEAAAPDAESLDAGATEPTAGESPSTDDASVTSSDASRGAQPSPATRAPGTAGVAAVTPATRAKPASGTRSAAPAPQAGPAHESLSAADSARSIADYEAMVALHEAALRDLYLQGERAIAAEVQAMLKAGQTEAQVARWASQARNALRQAIRDEGEPIVGAIAKAMRGARDMPSYESLRARGKTDAQIIAGASKSDAGATRWAGRLRIAGRIVIAVDIGIAVYHIASAPEVDRPRVMLVEASRMGGAIAGGWAGAKVGGAIGTAIEPGGGTAIGAGVGAIVGGIAGAIGGGWVAEWAIDEFYPPSATRFERQ